MRPSGRAADQLRDISLETNVAKHAEGSCLARFGDTHVLCAASVEPRVPPWMRDTGRGWVTAEYGMLPRSTHTRTNREASRGKQSGRTQETQRLIGRSLRAATNLEAMGEIQIKVEMAIGAPLDHEEPKYVDSHVFHEVIDGDEGRPTG